MQADVVDIASAAGNLELSKPSPKIIKQDEEKVATNAMNSLSYTDKSVVVDAATSKRLFRMINKRVLPPMLFAFMLQNLTKMSPSPASIMGLQADTHMEGDDFALANTMLFIGLIAGQIPANSVNQIFSLGWLLSGSMVSWGVVVLAMGFMRDRKPIFALRLILGLCQAMFGPCLLRMNAMWYTKSEQPIVTALYQSTIGFSSVLLAMLGYGFYYVNGTALFGWQYLFIVVAGLSILCGVYTFLTIPNSPVDARCYSDNDKLLLVERVRENDQGISNKEFKKDQVIEALRDPVSWILGIMICANGIMMGGIGVFGNILLHDDFGFDVQTSQLFTIPPGLMIVPCYLTAGWLVRKTNETYFVMLLFTIPAIFGNIVMSVVAPGPSTKYLLMVGYWSFCMFATVNPLNYMLLSRNIAGQTKKTVTFTMNFAFASAGNALGPLVFASQWSPRYLPTWHIHSALLFVTILLAMISRTLLARRNRDKIRAQRESGVADGTHELAFDDLTDQQNPEFRYSL